VARRTQLAVQRQLKRERAHLQWLEQHLPHTTQLAQCRQRIRTLVAQCAAAECTKQKKRCHTQRFFLTHTSNCVAQYTLHLL
jgi:hypothetical protein